MRKGPSTDDDIVTQIVLGSELKIYPDTEKDGWVKASYDGKKGYVKREFVEHDARLKKVILTEKGKESHESIEALISRLDVMLEDGIEEEELALFFKVTDKIKENLRKQKVECSKGGPECLEHC